MKIAIYNLSNDGFVNHYEYGVFITQLFGENKVINKIQKVDKNFHNYGKFLMSCYKLKKNVHLTHWKIDMDDYINKLTKF